MRMVGRDWSENLRVRWTLFWLRIFPCPRCAVLERELQLMSAQTRALALRHAGRPEVEALLADFSQLAKNLDTIIASKKEEGA